MSGSTGANGTGSAPSVVTGIRSAKRLILIGLPGAGKTTAGRLLADELDWEFLDFDDEIARRAGRSSVADVFRLDGETAFRAMEAQLTDGLSSRTSIVLAPGGGWAAQPGLLERARAQSAVIWLRVSVEEAIRRLRGSPVERPLLTGPDPHATLHELAVRRQARYATADLIIDVDGRTIAHIVAAIIMWLNQNTSPDADTHG